MKHIKVAGNPKPKEIELTEMTGLWLAKKAILRCKQLAPTNNIYYHAGLDTAIRLIRLAEKRIQTLRHVHWLQMVDQELELLKKEQDANKKGNTGSVK